MDIYALRPKDTSTLTTKRSNFRLNYNPYILQRSADSYYDKKQLRQIKNMALENAHGKPILKSNIKINTMDDDYYEDDSDEDDEVEGIIIILF